VKGVTDKRTQLLDGSKLLSHAAVSGLGLECVELLLRIAVGFDVGEGAGVSLVRREDQDFPK